MRNRNSYRSARRNEIIRELKAPWGNSWARAANEIAKLDERRATCQAAREFVAKTLVEQEIIFKTGRTEIVVLTALRQFWSKIAGTLAGTYVKPRMRRRLLRQLDLDLRSARA